MMSAHVGDVKCIWLDNPDVDDTFISEKFKCETKYDIFHVLQLYNKECDGNSLRPQFLADLSNSFYSVNEEDVAKLLNRMRATDPNFSRSNSW